MKRPNLEPEKILEIIGENLVPRDRFPGVLVEIRGYMLDSVGKKGTNDIGYFDDFAAIVHADNTITQWFHNVDPTDRVKGRAILQPGIHMYGPGPHNVSKGTSKMYPAARQAEKVTVKRMGMGDATFCDFFGINIHRAGGLYDPKFPSNTSSWGCQTQPADQWASFYKDLLKAIRGNELGAIDLGLWDPQSKYVAVPLFPVILIDETARREGNLIVSHRFEHDPS